MDEYQDVGPDQYELISALAGRSLADEEGKLTLFAVGDDDQNIYAFDGASVEYIRRFETDYAAKPAYLTENYRSTGHIISAADLLIAAASQRMKREHPIVIDRGRQKSPPGGAGMLWTLSLKDASKCCQQAAQLTQAMAVMGELERLSHQIPSWDWAKVAVISREWKFLQPLRSYCEMQQIPVQMAKKKQSSFGDCGKPKPWSVGCDAGARNLSTRSNQAMAGWAGSRSLVGLYCARRWRNTLLRHATQNFRSPISRMAGRMGTRCPPQADGLMLLAAHRAKGLEFDHVVVLDGGWDKVDEDEDRDARGGYTTWP